MDCLISIVDVRIFGIFILKSIMLRVSQGRFMIFLLVIVFLQERPKNEAQVAFHLYMKGLKRN